MSEQTKLAPKGASILLVYLRFSPGAIIVRGVWDEFLNTLGWRVDRTTECEEPSNG